MLAILFSWIVISFVTISFGDIFRSLYNKICGKDEEYNFIDTFLLGMCLITIILSISSLWLPSNHYILYSYIVIAIAYWIFNQNRLLSIFQRMKNFFFLFSMKEWILIGISLLAVLIYVSWVSHIFDSVYYHYQNIRWNEEYAVVPGLANLESRYGFNSNYLLLSAIFTFRFLFKEPLYTFQSLLIMYMMFWIFAELVRSKYELKRIILLIFFFFFFASSIDSITDTSTDIIPNACVFYLIARLVLYPDIFKNSNLLYYILPVSLITYKLSSAPFCLVGLIILIIYLKNKDYKSFTFSSVIALGVVVPWIVRTVIITGYLFYPLSGLDVFSFDWKLVKPVVDFESYSISVYADKVFNYFVTFQYFELYGYSVNKVLFIRTVFMVLMYLFIAVSPFFLGYKLYKKKMSHKNFYILYIILLLYIVYWYMLAPDFRFASGAFFGMVFLIIAILLTGKEKVYPKFAEITIVLFASIMLISSFKRIYNFYKLLYPTSIEEGGTPLYSVLYFPYSSKDQAKARYIPQTFIPYKMGNVTIYLTTDTKTGICYDMLPATSGQPLTNHTRGPEVSTVEARGNTIQEGFRPKKTE